MNVREKMNLLNLPNSLEEVESNIQEAIEISPRSIAPGAEQLVIR